MILNELEIEIKHTLERLDLKIRPKALVINPADRNLLIEAIPDLEERVKIYESNIVIKGTAYLMDREYIEKWRAKENE